MYWEEDYKAVSNNLIEENVTLGDRLISTCHPPVITNGQNSKKPK